MSTPRSTALTTSTPSNLPERSLNRQQILEEDEYTEALSHIIARDFFPSLVHLESTNDYLDALRSQDPKLINSTVRRLQEISSTPTPRRAPLQTPSQTPFGAGASAFDTPRTERGGEPAAKRARYDADLSLDAFQARYTSEDNSSFTQILDEENRRRKEKYGWAWDAQRRVEAQRERMLEGRERMMIEAPPAAGVREKFLIEAPTPAGLITAAGEEEKEKEKEKEDTGKGMDVAVVDKGNETKEAMEVDVMAPPKDTRSAGVDGWQFKARNSLMFAPDADAAPYDPQYGFSRDTGNPKVVKHGNTRLPEQEERTSGSRSASVPSSPTHSRIDAAITGTPYRPRTPPGTFNYVPNLPSPTASELGPTAVKQLMTVGTLMGTPRVLSHATDDPNEPVPTPSTPFHLPAPSQRERVAQRLSNTASASLRAKAGLLGGTPRAKPAGGGKGAMPPPTWTPRRAEGNLTPAARRLLDRTMGGTAAARRADAMGRTAGWEGRGKEKDMGRVRWTPTPSPVTRRG